MFALGLVRGSDWHVRDLVGPRTKEEVDDVAFMRLQPIQTICRNWTNVQAVNLHRRSCGLDQRLVLRQQSPNQGGTDSTQQLVLRALHNADEGEHVLLGSDLSIG